jgi:hypothetical protein
MKKLDEQKAQEIAERFRVMKAKDEKENCIRKWAIPETIEQITDRLFHGVLIDKDAVKYLRTLCIKNADRYALNAEKIDKNLVPFIASIELGENYHAVAAIDARNKANQFTIIDDGLPSIVSANRVLYAYKIVENGAASPAALGVK